MTTRYALPLAALLVISATVAGAQALPPDGPPGAPARVLPGHEILTIVRSTGFEPVGRPVQKGLRYELDAIDPYDADVHLVLDARSGEIIAVRDGAGLDAPPLPGQAYAQANRSNGWPFGRTRETRPVPPRDIPAARHSASLDPKKPPLPRPRPDGSAEVTGAIKPQQGMPPVMPMDDTKTSPIAPVAATSKAGPPAPSSVPPAERTNPTENAATGPSGSIKIIPVAPLE